MSLRGAMLLGLAVLAALATWWLGALVLALRSGADALAYGAPLLAALWMTRAVLIALLGVRTAAEQRPARAARALLALALVPGPLALLAAAASEVPALRVLGGELALLALALLVVLAGRTVRRVALDPLWRRPLALSTGVLLAAGLWWQRHLWLAWLPR
jgi:hypothetical protein